MARVTFIMPAYNAAKYIDEAIASVKAQTVSDWRLIIADDCSSDDTPQIARRYARDDSRISVIHLSAPSGGAYQPRKRAIELANTPLVAPIDADDIIEPDYLRKLLRLQSATDADEVYPAMWLYTSKGKSYLLPVDKSLLGTAVPGRRAMVLTFDGWKINCNGGVIKKDLYLRAYELFDSSISYSCADELLTRQLLYLSEQTAFSDARYFYRDNQDSVTRALSAKKFDYLLNNIALEEFIRRVYGRDSEEYRLIQRQIFHGIFDAYKLLARHDFSSEAKDYGHNMIDTNRRVLDTSLISSCVSPRYLALYRQKLISPVTFFRLFGKK